MNLPRSEVSFLGHVLIVIGTVIIAAAAIGIPMASWLMQQHDQLVKHDDRLNALEHINDEWRGELTRKIDKITDQVGDISKALVNKQDRRP